jgi:hypothetical protein
MLLGGLHMISPTKFWILWDLSFFRLERKLYFGDVWRWKNPGNCGLKQRKDVDENDEIHLILVG